MKHIVLSIGQILQNPADLFRGLDKQTLKDQFFLLQYTGEPGEWIRQKSDLPVGCYLFGTDTSWYQIIGNVRNTFLRDQFRFQLDVLVNASGTEAVVDLLGSIRQQASILGLGCAIRILFLADSLSKDWKREETFLEKLQQSYSKEVNSSDVFPWNSLYLLMVDNSEQENLRRKVLPFILNQESDTFEERTAKTCCVSAQSLNIEALKEIPLELAKKTVCGMLTGKNKVDGLSALLLGRGRQIRKETASSLEFMKETFNRTVPFIRPSAYDLLVHKGSPEGDCNTREMVDAFFRDNPECDPERYDHLGIADIEKISLICKAADQWEELVLDEAYRSGDLSDLLAELESGSTFDQILSAQQKPYYLNSDLNLSEKEGYSQAALDKLSPYTEKLGDYLEQVVLYTRLMLIRSRIPTLRKKIRYICSSRQAAVNRALQNLRTEEVAKMTGTWGYQLQNELSQKAGQITMPACEEDLDVWIDNNTQKLLQLIPQPDFAAAQKELANSVEGKMREMESAQPRKLLSVSLDSIVKHPLPASWYIYQKAKVSIPGCYYTDEPLILCLREWYLDLNARLPNQQVFLPELISVETGDSSMITDVQTETEDSDWIEEKPAETMYPREEYEEFNGSLRWIWKDTSWKSACVEVFETENGKLKETPLLTKNVTYRSDDTYSIVETGQLPSGAVLCFRVTYLDKGRPVTGAEEMIWRRSPRTVLKVETLSTREGGFLSMIGKKPYVRLRIHSGGYFSPDHIAVAGSTGYVYRAAWEETDKGWTSERLPVGEDWYVVDLPGDPFEYETI